MGKIKIGIRRDTVKNRRRSGHMGLVPSHMRDLENLSLDVGETVRKPSYAPWQDVHAFVTAKFFAFGHQELQAQTDPQVWASGADELKHWLEEVMFTKLRHTIPEGSLAGKHDGVGACDVLGALRDMCGVSDTLECLVHAAQIADAAV